MHLETSPNRDGQRRPYDASKCAAEEEEEVEIGDTQERVWYTRHT